MGATGERVRRTYRSSRRAAQARLTRQRVLAAAAAVFLGGGYGGATMRAIATEAHVSVPMVESLFGTKARLLKAAIDVAIAGDDEPVPVLQRSWVKTAASAESVEEFLAIVAVVIGPAQARSAGLVLAVLEGASSDSELAGLAAQMTAERARTAEWIVDTLTRKATLRTDCTRPEAIDTLWVLMDPAVFDRLIRHRRWSRAHYERWFARSINRLLVADVPLA